MTKPTLRRSPDVIDRPTRELLAHAYDELTTDERADYDASIAGLVRALRGPGAS